jgi:hypothetical protein
MRRRFAQFFRAFFPAVLPLLWTLPLALQLLPRPAAAQQAPHAWLFGEWTGGLFPVPSAVSAQACIAQPTVIFTRDVVMRAVLTDPQFVQRVIETALTENGATTFRFAPAALAANPLLGTDTQAQGFGCPNPNGLRVIRRTENEIAFPDCADFPYPLVRCGSR